MYVWPDNSVYKGDVEAGLRHGKGTFFCADTPSIYSGDWVHGRRTGTVSHLCAITIVTWF